MKVSLILTSKIDQTGRCAGRICYANITPMYLPRQVTRTFVSEEKHNKKQNGEVSEWG